MSYLFSRGGVAAIITPPTTGYCVRCKRKVALLDAKPVKFKNGRPAIRGACPDCGSAVSRILAKVLPDITAFLLGE